MKYRLRQLLLLGLTIILCQHAKLLACSKDNYIIGYSEFFPFMYTVNGGEIKGLDIEVVRAVFEQAGCTIHFADMPWARMLMGIKQGVPDVILVASITVERSMFAYFSLPYRNEQMRFMVRRNETQRWPLKKLEDVIKYQLRIATILDNWFGEEFNQLKMRGDFKNLIVNVSQLSDRFSMLLSGRVDAILHDKIYLSSLAEKRGFREKVDFLPFVVNDAPVHFMFSKKTTPIEDLALINQKLKAFKKTPKYKALFGEMKVHFHEG